MKLRFWGTRGSLAKPGPGTVRYGGNTSCIQVESKAGTLLLLDCGTGAHALGQQLVKGDLGRPGHILISHTHWDHIQGIPFFAPLFKAGQRWNFYAAQGFGESLKDTLAGQMEYTYFPVTMDALHADVDYHNLVEGRFQVEDIVVHTRYLNHPALTLGFRLEVDGVVVVYSCDHEPYSQHLAGGSGEITGMDLLHAEFLRNADLVIHDAQYTAEEYPGKLGWGHSPVEYAVYLCESVGVRRLALTHHDPMRDDLAVDLLMERVRTGLQLRQSKIEVFAAAEGMTIELERRPDAQVTAPSGTATESALRPVHVPSQTLVLLGVSDPALAELLTTAAGADGAQVRHATDGTTALAQALQLKPSLLVLEHPLPGLSAVEVAHFIRAQGKDWAQHLPLVVVSRHPAPAPAGSSVHEISEWLQLPFSSEFARTKIRTWLMRTHCRWQRPALPANEADRIAALRALALLDTPREERFDRYTRMAARMFEVPVALISLIDTDRQWFKSCFGAEESETPREISFCAHAIHNRELLLVPDARMDPRFADNPSVSGGPRIRFYAGFPLHLPNGLCMGTLCLIDQRPRQLTNVQRDLLRDLGGLVERELVGDWEAS